MQPHPRRTPPLMIHLTVIKWISIKSTFSAGVHRLRYMIMGMPTRKRGASSGSEMREETKLETYIIIYEDTSINRDEKNRSVIFLYDITVFLIVFLVHRQIERGSICRDLLPRSKWKQKKWRIICFVCLWHCLHFTPQGANSTDRDYKHPHFFYLYFQGLCFFPLCRYFYCQIMQNRW